MNALVIHAHPEPKSFCSALCGTARTFFAERGQHVEVSDLYAMSFNPVTTRANFTTVHDPGYFKPQLEERYASEHAGFAPDLQAEMDKLRRADLLIFTFPLWWFGLPAILKGWVDRVFAMGFAYGNGRVFEDGVFRGKRAILALTTGGPAPRYQPGGALGDIDMLLYPIQHGMLWFCGMDVLPPFIAYGPAHVDDLARTQMLEAFEQHLASLDEMSPIAFE